MKILNIMSRSVVTAPGNTLVQDICRLMEKNKIGSVVIVKDKTVSGIITERDIVSFIGQYGCSVLSQKKASEIMVTPVFTMSPKLETSAAMQFMVSKRIRRLPITENKRLVGIITYGDIIREVQKDLAEAQLKTQQLKLEVSKDGLTHVFTQKYFKTFLDREVERVKRYGGLLALLMVDVDHFKKVNDTYGHDAGDYILIKVSELIRKNTRKINVIGRYGGDEFSIIAPISDVESAKRLGDRLRQFVEQTKFHYQGQIIRVTLSIGVAGWDKSIIDGRSFIVKADKALYKSKHAGRNTVSIA
ncbi:MAG: GGDEF domain-containing protein [Candidatus Firestonebacteria bacterium]